jgi:hypothetical protein
MVLKKKTLDEIVEEETVNLTEHKVNLNSISKSIMDNESENYFFNDTNCSEDSEDDTN